MRGASSAARSVAAMAVATCVAATAVACGGSGTATTPAISGTFAYCSAITTYPGEFYLYRQTGHTTTKEAAGSDIEIGREAAKRLGHRASFVDTPFDKIIDAVLAKKCDAIISFMNDTAARRQRLAFVDYLAAGQSLLVRKSSGTGIHAAADLTRKAVSVGSGTTEQEFLSRESQKLQASGQQPIRIVAFSDDNDAIYRLTQGKVDAYFGDAPAVEDVARRDRSLAVAAQLVKPIPVGIALRKGDSRIAPLKKAIDAMYSDGTMKRILGRWKLASTALKK